MHTIEHGNIMIHHNSDFSGDVFVVVKRSDEEYSETRIPGNLLLSGDFEYPSRCALSDRELRMATSVAVYSYITSHLVNVVEQLPFPGSQK